MTLTVCACVCVEVTEVHVVKEWFQYRNDKLEQREVDHLDKVTVERFGNGRRFHLQRKSTSCSATNQEPLPVTA